MVISDMRMPGMNGAQLLGEVARLHPQMVRILLSGQSDQEAIFHSLGPTHQFLAKPCDAETLKATVCRAFALRDLLASEAVLGVVSQMKALPSLPTLYCEIVEALETSNISLDEVGAIVAKDLGMTAKILQMVNSAFFGLPRRVSNPSQAVSIIGTERLKSLVLSIHVFSRFHVEKSPGFSLDALWQHSLRVAQSAREIAKEQGVPPRVIEDAFTAGLLHDAGKLVLASELPQPYSEAVRLARDSGLTLQEAECAQFGATHAEVGAYLIGLWGLPGSIVDALAFHHRPLLTQATAFDTVTAVHVANACDHEAHPGNSMGLVNALDREYIAGLGLAERIPGWQALCSRLNTGDGR